MAKVTIPLNKKLLDDLAQEMAQFDQLQSEVDKGPWPLLEWKVPPMPRHLKGEIRSDEHPPPHFHVMHDDEDVGFSLLDGSRLPREVGLERYDRVIKRWWQENQLELCATWNKSRPTDCTVGPVPLPPPR
jgi:Domain of unknown function (DUF4160)